jgi:hypothetical protein
VIDGSIASENHAGDVHPCSVAFRAYLGHPAKASAAVGPGCLLGAGGSADRHLDARVPSSADSDPGGHGSAVDLWRGRFPSVVSPVASSGSSSQVVGTRWAPDGRVCGSVHGLEPGSSTDGIGFGRHGFGAPGPFRRRRRCRLATRLVTEGPPDERGSVSQGDAPRRKDHPHDRSGKCLVRKSLSDPTMNRCSSAAQSAPSLPAGWTVFWTTATPGGGLRGKTLANPEPSTSATTPTGTESDRSMGLGDAQSPGSSLVRPVPSPNDQRRHLHL